MEDEFSEYALYLKPKLASLHLMSGDFLPKSYNVPPTELYLTTVLPMASWTLYEMLRREDAYCVLARIKKTRIFVMLWRSHYLWKIFLQEITK